MKKHLAFSFPDSIPTPDLDDFLDSKNCQVRGAKASADQGHSGSSETYSSLPSGTKSNVERIYSQLISKGFDPKTEPIVVDCDASAKRISWSHNVSPCITRSRYRGHWLTSRDRRMNLNEMLRLQGMNPEELDVNIPTTDFGRMIGNSMSVNVVQRI